MTQPTLRFRPLRPAVAADGASTLDLLVTITTPDLPNNPSNWVVQIDPASSSSLLTSAMSWPSRSCICSSGTATIRFLALL